MCIFACNYVVVPVTKYIYKIEKIDTMSEASEAYIDKDITVRIEEWGRGASQVYRDKPDTINGDRTVQQAVKEAYPPFPKGGCRRVVCISGDHVLFLWSPTEPGKETWERDLYNRISEGDVIKIEVAISHPEGPEGVVEGNVDSDEEDWDDQDYDTTDPLGPVDNAKKDDSVVSGPKKGRQLCDLLRKLKASF